MDNYNISKSEFCVLDSKYLKLIDAEFYYELLLENELYYQQLRETEIRIKQPQGLHYTFIRQSRHSIGGSE